MQKTTGFYAVYRMITWLVAFAVYLFSSTIYAKEITIAGEVRPMSSIEELLSKMEEDGAGKGSLYVILNRKQVETIERILDGKFKFTLKEDLSTDEVTLEAVYPKDFVSLEGKHFVPQQRLKDKRRSFIEETIILTTAEHRFLEEKKIVKGLINQGNCSGAFENLNLLELLFLPPKLEFYYILVKLRTDALFEAADSECYVSDEEIEKIFDIEETEEFQAFTKENLFNIYKQFGYALQRFNTPERSLSPDRKLLDIITYCLKKAVSYQKAEELRGESGWLVSTYLVEELIKSERYGDAIDEIERYFKYSELPEINLKSSQKKAILRFLFNYGLALSHLTDRLAYRESSYIKTMATHPEFLHYWSNYQKLLERRSYLYPETSVTTLGISLYTNLTLSKRIVEMATN